MATRSAGVLLLWLCGCAVTYPSGWTRRAAPPELLKATPGVMYGDAPLSWDTAAGERILVEVQDASVASGLGHSASSFRFDVAFRGASQERILCGTQPAGPDVPETRFGCWSPESERELLRFWLAPNLGCPLGSPAQTLTTRECWNGELSLDGEQVQLRHGHLESTGSPVGYLSWVGERQQLLLAADIVREMQVELFDASPAEGVPATLRRRLVLLTVALAYWEHASKG